MFSEKHCLALLLDAELKAAALPPQEDADLVVGPSRLIGQPGGSWMAFHDWLRNRNLPEKIVGVRLWPIDMKNLPGTAVQNKPYIDSIPGKNGAVNGVMIWFGNAREFDHGLSGDQAFGFSRILLSPDKSRGAVVLDMYGLKPDELNGLETSLRLENAAWA